MREIKNGNIAEISKTGSLLSLRKYFKKIRAIFKYWLIASIIVGILNVGFTFLKKSFTGKISAVINFSFDGIESGIDPNGNKFEVNGVKSESIVSESLEELGYTDIDAETVCSAISIDGVLPNDVVNRLTSYIPQFSSDNIHTSRNILDTSYYPTQYRIQIECEKIDLSKGESADLLNKIIEKYNNVFYSTYGYNSSLETAVMSVDYKSYDYVDAVDVFQTSLEILKKYINELASNDSTRFRADNGYTFSDISSSIDTICNEDLEIILSYIMTNNATKDKNNLIANYEFKIDSLKRSKKVADDKIATLNKTIDEYKKDTLLILNNGENTTDSAVSQSSKAYNDLISQKVSAQTTSSRCEQNIKLYNQRINSLKSNTINKANNEYVEKEFERISSKIDSLLSITNETASQYYENVVLNNAYSILSEANSSVFTVLKESISDSFDNIIAMEMLVFALYLTVALILCFVVIPENFNFHDDVLMKLKVKKNKKQKNNK